MSGFYSNAFIKYILPGKTLLYYTNKYSTNNYRKNNKIICKYFKNKYFKSRVFIQKIDETRNYLLDEIKHPHLIGKKHKKTCKYSNYVEHLLILASKVTVCVSISAFASLVVVPVGIRISAVELKTCAIPAVIKK